MVADAGSEDEEMGGGGGVGGGESASVVGSSCNGKQVQAFASKTATSNAPSTRSERDGRSCAAETFSFGTGVSWIRSVWQRSTD